MITRCNASYDEHTLRGAQKIDSWYEIASSVWRKPVFKDIKSPHDSETNDPPAPINTIQEQTTINMTTSGTSTTEEAAQGFEYLSDYKIIVCKEHGFGLRNLRRHLL